MKQLDHTPVLDATDETVTIEQGNFLINVSIDCCRKEPKPNQDNATHKSKKPEVTRDANTTEGNEIVLIDHLDPDPPPKTQPQQSKTCVTAITKLSNGQQHL